MLSMRMCDDHFEWFCLIQILPCVLTVDPKIVYLTMPIASTHVTHSHYLFMYHIARVSELLFLSSLT